MSGPADNDERADAARRARMQQAENRMVVQAALHAKRSGQLTPRQDTSASQAFTALAVILAVVATLALAIRYGS